MSKAHAVRKDHDGSVGYYPAEAAFTHQAQRNGVAIRGTGPSMRISDLYVCDAWGCTERLHERSEPSPDPEASLAPFGLARKVPA